MELQQLESFIEVAKEGSFSKAAEKMYISQPTLSIRVQNLEKELHAALFIRSHAGIQLSPCGELFFPYAEQCMELMREGRKKLEGLMGSRIRIGAANPFSASVLPFLLPPLHRHFPEIKIEVTRTGFSEDIVKMLHYSRVDVGFVNEFHRLEGVEKFEHVELYQDDFVLVGGSMHPLCQTESIDPSQISRFGIVHLSSDTIITKIMKDFFASQSIKSFFGMEIHHISGIKEMVKTGEWLAFLPKVIVQDDLHAKTLVEVPVDCPTPTLTTSLIYHPYFPENGAIDFLKQEVLDIFQRHFTRAMKPCAS